MPLWRVSFLYQKLLNNPYTTLKYPFAIQILKPDNSSWFYFDVGDGQHIPITYKLPLSFNPNLSSIYNCISDPSSLKS